MLLKKSANGSALPEYVLPLVLFAVATLAVIPNGANLNTWFQQMMGQNTGGQMQADTLNINTGKLAWVPQPAPLPANNAGNIPGVTTASSAIPTNSPLPTGGGALGSVEITLPGGQKINLGNYPTNMSNLVETAGASGTTLILAQVLRDYAKQLADQGLITSAQSNQIIELANKGYKISSLQKTLEDKVTEVQGLTDAQRLEIGGLSLTTVVFDGVTYNPASGLVELIDALPGRVNDVQNSGALLHDFLTLKVALRNNGLDYGTPQGAIFNKLADQLIDTIDGTSNSWYAINEVAKWTPSQLSANILTTNQLSNTSKADAAGICAIGNGVDAGVKCN